MGMSTEEDRKKTPALTEEMRQMCLSNPKYIFYQQFMDLCYRERPWNQLKELSVENKIIIEEMYEEYYIEILFLLFKIMDKYTSKNGENIPGEIELEQLNERINSTNKNEL